jgi:hypothetical protein
MNTPRFVAVVYDGENNVLSTHPAEEEGQAQGDALRAYVEQQQRWERADAGTRQVDPPGWELYAKFDQALATVVHPPNQGPQPPPMNG